MSYWVGDVVDLTWQVQVADVDTTPATLVVVVTQPDGTAVTVPTVLVSTGTYAGQFSAVQPGHHTWVATADGGAVAVQAGVFDVWDPNPQVAPVTGVAGLWSDAAALARRPPIVAYNAAAVAGGGEPIEPNVLNDALRFASEILFALSGRQFGGECRTYCRPVARPEGWDVRSWGAAGLDYWSSWGASYAMGSGAATAPAQGYRGSLVYPHEVALSYPVRRIEQVKVDGQVIPPQEYRVDDFRLLIRTRPAPDYQPTARADWPHWQALWLPDTEPNTWSVSYFYGVTPPQSGVTAAEVFATELALDMVGADNRLPARVREISRQGETAMVTDALESLREGWTGIPTCDWFIASVNPIRLQRRGGVWSPDTQRVRTPTT